MKYHFIKIFSINTPLIITQFVGFLRQIITTKQLGITISQQV